MLCPYCGDAKTAVTNSRAKKEAASVWRRRQCPRCNHIFTTYESVDMSGAFRFNNKDGRVAFSKVTLLMSLIEVLAYTGHTPDDAYWLTETIQARLMAHSASDTIERSLLVETTRDALAAYDELASRAYLAKHPL